MRYRRLGHSDLKVSAISLGTSSFGRRCDLDEARAIVNRALDEGITLIDTAAAYPGSEPMLGEALEGRRHEALILTKYAHPSASLPHAAAGSRDVIRASLERSLRDLRTDYVDIYMMHWPDPATPIQETLAAADELVRDGKVRYLGCSNFSAWRIVEASWTARSIGLTEFIASEDLYSLVDPVPEREVIPACMQYGIGELAYAPLHYGLLTGRYHRGALVPPGTRLGQQPAPVAAELFDRVEALEAFGRQRQLSLLEVAIGGLAAQPGVASVIAGCSRIEHVRPNAAAIDWQPSEEDLAVLNELRKGWR
jgi:aryl-alcohol dehydrogenase-like predicted oxidoreductase